jgi:hypothetical protein
MNLLPGEVVAVSCAIAVPPDHQGLLPLLPRIRVDRAINVITFKTNVSPSGFDRPVTKYFQDQILSRLGRSGIGNLTVIIERDPRRELVLRFEGADEEVAKAKATFEEHSETC